MSFIGQQLVSKGEGCVEAVLLQLDPQVLVWFLPV